ncbi:hypothetical protein GmRootV15_18990 [Variovorax sp. V15]
MAHVVGGRVLQVFERELIEVAGAAHQLGVERAQHPQHADGLLAACVEPSISSSASGEPARRLNCLKVSWRTVPNRWQCSSALGIACSICSSVRGAAEATGADVGLVMAAV